eukprot:g5594.t1
MLRRLITVFGLASASASGAINKFGIGAYDVHGGVGPVPSLLTQLPLARDLAGANGSVLLVATMMFRQNGNASSCSGGCVPSATDAASIQQAYALGLRPVVRLAQWPRTIRDFADDAATTPRQSFHSLARAYRTFAAALPLPPDGTSALDVIVLNEPNVCGEWQCKLASAGGAGSSPPRLHANDSAAEVGVCLRDILAALRDLPRLRLSAAPTAYAAPASCGCDGSRDPAVNFSAPTDISYMRTMLAAAPDLYARADFFNSHPYPFAGRPFAAPLGRGGSVHYRAQLDASGRPDLPVVISECGWKGGNESEKAASIVAAYREEWLEDERVQAVMPFLLTAANGSEFADVGWPWVRWLANGGLSVAPQFNATRDLRCQLGVGGAC